MADMAEGQDTANRAEKIDMTAAGLTALDIKWPQQAS